MYIQQEYYDRSSSSLTVVGAFFMPKNAFISFYPFRLIEGLLNKINKKNLIKRCEIKAYRLYPHFILLYSGRLAKYD